MRSCTPALNGEFTWPGIPITWRCNSEASYAVLREPLRTAASTTTVPKDNAAIIRFRIRNLALKAFALGLTSEINKPLADIARKREA